MPLAEVLSWGESGRYVRSTWSEATAVKNQLKTSGYVFGAARFRADAIASLPIKVQIKRGGEWENAPDQTHPLKTLMDKPNADMTRHEFIQRCILSHDFGGNMLVTKERGLDASFSLGIAALWPIPTDHLRPVPKREQGGIAEYEKISYPSKGKRYAKEDVIHVQCFPDPTKPYWGLSIAEPGDFAAESDVEASRYNAKMFKQGTFPSGIISLKGNPNHQQLTQARKAWDSQLAGSDNAGKVGFMGMDAKYQPFSLTAKDLQVTEGREVAQREILVAWGVPMQLLTPTESTYNNLLLAELIFWLFTGLPLAAKIYGGLERGLAPEYGEDVRIWFDTSHIKALSDLPQETVTKAKDLASMGVPLTEVNRRLGLGLEEDALSNLTDADVVTLCNQSLDALHTPATSALVAETLGMTPPTHEQIETYWIAKGATPAGNVVPFPDQDTEAA